MKLGIAIAAAFVALAFLPVAAANVGTETSTAAATCIVPSRTISVGGFYLGLPYVYVPGQSRSVLFLHVQTDPITAGGGGVYVPQGPIITTPSVCYGPIVDDLLELIA